MKKRLTIIAVLMMLCSTMFGQHWIFTQSHLYENTMTIHCTVSSINGIEQTQISGFEIAAFSNNVLRSNGVTLKATPWGVSAKLNVHGNNFGEAITFRLYKDGKELETDKIVSFRINGVEGSANDPIGIEFYETHYDFSGYFSNSMSVIAAINVDNNQLESGAYELAAFIGEGVNETIRGVARPYKEEINGESVYVALLAVGANESDEGKDVTFKLWDFSSNKELTCVNTLPFITNKMYGDPEPYVMYFFDEKEPSVARIADTYYTTLAEALNKANDGDEIDLIQNAASAGVEINKGVTIDFNGYTYSLENAETGITIDKVLGEFVTLKNGTLNVAESAQVSYLVKNYADLTIENMTFNGSENNSYVLSFVSGEVSIKNSSINAYDAEHYAFQTCDEEAFSAPVVTLWHESADSDGNVINYSNEVIGLVEYTAGSIIGNTNAKLEVVAKKQFTKVSGNVGARDGWGTISTPVYTNGSTIDIPELNTAAHDLYKYNEPTSTWLYFQGTTAPFEKFNLGQGYLYANNDVDYTFELKGKLANGRTVSFGISYNPDTAHELAGFNFIGNPYLHQISFDNFKAEEDYELAPGFYVVSEDGSLQTSLPNQTISPMESVMLQLKPKATRSGNIKTMLNIYPTAVEKRSSTNNGYLAINVSNENYSDVAYVALGENEGLNKIGHYNTEAPMVYVPVDGADYAIATMNQDVTMVPVSFKAATMGEYTIAVEAQNCEYSTMTLVDRFTGVETNLLLEDYSFIAKSNDSADRFFIRLDNSQQTTDNSNFAYINNGMINIDVEGQAMINVYDVTGRSVAEYNVFESASISTSDFANGMYIIRMSDESGVKVQKVVIE